MLLFLKKKKKKIHCHQHGHIVKDAHFAEKCSIIILTVLFPDPHWSRHPAVQPVISLTADAVPTTVAASSSPGYSLNHVGAGDEATERLEKIVE